MAHLLGRKNKATASGGGTFTCWAFLWSQKFSLAQMFLIFTFYFNSIFIVFQLFFSI